jgi:hypothetical protein
MIKMARAEGGGGVRAHARTRVFPPFNARGRQKKIDGPPRTFAKSQTHPPTSRLFFPLAFFLSTFLGVSRHGEFKNTIQTFLQKVHVENFFEQNPKKIDVSFSSTFFCFIAFSGVSQRWEFKSTTKNVLQKKSCRKVFTKKSTKNPKLFFSRFFSIAFLDVSR